MGERAVLTLAARRASTTAVTRSSERRLPIAVLGMKEKRVFVPPFRWPHAESRLSVGALCTRHPK
jgi:hypothetical protein